MEPDITVRSIVVMGVTSSGKSTVASLLAAHLDYVFLDGDWFHTPENIAKMSAGYALNDEERWPWLAEVGRKIRELATNQRGSVTACSALKRSYRDRLREYVPDAYFVYLNGSFSEIEARLTSREDGFMPPSLLASQFVILEPLQDDERGIRIDIARAPIEIVGLIEAELRTK
jgi:carbohydrate kinase (thermoresistant glucokinase family)